MFHGAASKCQKLEAGSLTKQQLRMRDANRSHCACVRLLDRQRESIFLGDALVCRLRRFYTFKAIDQLEPAATLSDLGSGGDCCASTWTPIRRVIGTATKRAISTTVSRVGRARKRTGV